MPNHNQQDLNKLISDTEEIESDITTLVIVIILIIDFFWKGEDVKFTRGEVISIGG